MINLDKLENDRKKFNYLKQILLWLFQLSLHLRTSTVGTGTWFYFWMRIRNLLADPDTKYCLRTTVDYVT